MDIERSVNFTNASRKRDFVKFRVSPAVLYKM